MAFECLRIHLIECNSMHLTNPNNMTMMHWDNYDGAYGYDFTSIRLYIPFLWGSRVPCSLLSQLYWWWHWWWLRGRQWCWFIVWWWWRCGCQRWLCMWYHFWILIESNGTWMSVMTSKQFYYHRNDCNDI